MNWSAEIEAGFGDLLRDVGEDVLWTDAVGVLHLNDDGTPKRALFKAPGQLILSNMQISDEFAIEYREADFVGLAHGDELRMHDRRFTVRTVLQGDDPVLRTATLTRLDDRC